MQGPIIAVDNAARMSALVALGAAFQPLHKATCWLQLEGVKVALCGSGDGGWREQSSVRSRREGRSGLGMEDKVPLASPRFQNSFTSTNCRQPIFSIQLGQAINRSWSGLDRSLGQR